MNKPRPWTTALDSNFISKLSERQIAAGMVPYGNGVIRDGRQMSFDDWDRESREIGRQIIADHPEYAYILPIIEIESPLLKCSSCELDFVPRAVNRTPGTVEMRTGPSDMCEMCYNDKYPK